MSGATAFLTAATLADAAGVAGVGFGVGFGVGAGGLFTSFSTFIGGVGGVGDGAAGIPSFPHRQVAGQDRRIL